MDSNTTPAQDTGMDEIDKIINSYQQKAEFATPPGAVPTASPGNVFNAPQPGGALPFVSHDPTQNPKQEYYQRGAKKGQPKPPKKGTAPPLNPAGQLSIQATVFITGALFITMVDLLIPLIITTVYNWMNAKKKDSVLMDYEKMKMSPSQKNDLAPIGDAVVRELKLNGSPTLLFFLGMVGVYFMNFIMHKSKAEKEQAIKKAQEQKTKNNTYEKTQNNSGKDNIPHNPQYGRETNY